MGGAVVMIMPFLWLVSSSFKPENDIFIFPPKWIPNPWRPQNYVDALTYKPFNIYIANTLIIVAIESDCHSRVGLALCLRFCAHQVPGDATSGSFSCCRP